MQYNLLNTEIKDSINSLVGDYGFSVDPNGIETHLKFCDSGVKFEFNDGKLTIYAQKTNQFIWALKEFSDLFANKPIKDGFTKTYTPRFEDLTYMLDCSRNAVYKIPVIEKLVSQLAVAGYNQFMLYTEDTFKVDDYPYFGYLRTPFTESDIKKIDAYCQKLGIELIPCIQTLGHFERILRYPAMQHLFDIDEILLVGEEETYKFIESLISTCSRYFSSKKIHIGMDEAYLLGRGRYLDINGYRTRFEIMKEHLDKVNRICQKYGYKPMIWSDMFFSLTLSGQYTKMDFDNTLKDIVPKDIELVYWDYYHTDRDFYDGMIEKHRVFDNPISFATGAWKWLGFTPDNRFSFKAMEESAIACQKNQIKHYMVTGWGDNGAESSIFSTMPSVYYAGYINYHDYKMDKNFEKAFQSFANMPLKDFMTIDLANRITEHNDIEERNSANKYLLFNDILLGTLDTIIERGQKDLYKKHAKDLKKVVNKGGEYAYIFKTQQALCEVLAVKCELGIELREAYAAKDMQKLAELKDTLKKLLKLIDNFYEAFLYQWTLEAKPNGFDVQDVRIGALKQRVHSAIRKLDDYISGKSSEIPELGEELLCFMGGGKNFEKDFDQCEFRFRRMTSVNVNN